MSRFLLTFNFCAIALMFCASGALADSFFVLPEAATLSSTCVNLPNGTLNGLGQATGCAEIRAAYVVAGAPVMERRKEICLSYGGRTAPVLLASINRCAELRHQLSAEFESVRQQSIAQNALMVLKEKNEGEFSVSSCRVPQGSSESVWPKGFLQGCPR
jgi:hypothetical protein